MLCKLFDWKIKKTVLCKSEQKYCFLPIIPNFHGFVCILSSTKTLNDKHNPFFVWWNYADMYGTLWWSNLHWQDFVELCKVFLRPIVSTFQNSFIETFAAEFEYFSSHCSNTLLCRKNTTLMNIVIFLQSDLGTLFVFRLCVGLSSEEKSCLLRASLIK